MERKLGKIKADDTKKMRVYARGIHIEADLKEKRQAMGTVADQHERRARQDEISDLEDRLQIIKDLGYDGKKPKEFKLEEKEEKK